MTASLDQVSFAKVAPVVVQREVQSACEEKQKVLISCESEGLSPADGAQIDPWEATQLRNFMRLSRLRVKEEPDDLLQFGWNTMGQLKPINEDTDSNFPQYVPSRETSANANFTVCRSKR